MLIRCKQCGELFDEWESDLQVFCGPVCADDHKQEFVALVEAKLREQGINLDRRPIVVSTSLGNQCFMTGEFAGYSISNLLNFWASERDARIHWINDSIN